MDTPLPSVHNGLLALPRPTRKTSKTARAKVRIIAARYGETGLSAFLLPLSVDGLVVVASISAVELSGRLHAAQSLPPAQPAPPPAPPAQPNVAVQAAVPSDDPPGTPAAAAPSGKPAVDNPGPADAAARARADHRGPAAGGNPNLYDRPAADRPPSHNSGRDTADGSPHGHDGTSHDIQRRRRRGAATRTAVIDTYLQDPTTHPTVIADKVGTSERTVRRYLDEFRAQGGTVSANGGNTAEHSYSGRSR